MRLALVRLTSYMVSATTPSFAALLAAVSTSTVKSPRFSVELTESCLSASAWAVIWAVLDWPLVCLYERCW